MNIEKIKDLTAQDIDTVNKVILEQLKSNVQLINNLGYYIFKSGGKRIRSMVTVLAAKAVGYKGLDHIYVASLIESIHIATILHDDVVDKSDTRRGKKSTNIAFGNAASVLVGDFIYTRAFQMMTNLGSLQIIKIMSEAVNIIAEGEVLQLMNINNPDITEETYMHTIYSKTARLFEAAAQCAGILSRCSNEQEHGLREYGKYLGIAFQIIDDLLDYSSDSISFGKKIGNDLNEGKATLPLLHAINNSNPKQSTMIRKAIKQGNARHLLKTILEVMITCNSLVWTRKRAEEEVNKAIDALTAIPNNMWRDALITLAKAVVQRKK